MTPEEAQREVERIYAELHRRASQGMPLDFEFLRTQIDGFVRDIRLGGPIPQEMSLLWERNEAWKVILDEGQREWFELWQSGDTSMYNGSGRQRGKSLFALSLIDFACRSFPGTRTRWTGLTIDSARAIVAQAADDFWVTCPSHLKPIKKGDDYHFPNGSILIVIGTDAQTFRRGRGFGRISIDVRDECGFYQDFSSIDAALTPGLSVPGPSGKMGRVLFNSTPAESPAHPSNQTVRAHQARGAFICETFLQNPRVDPEAVIKAEVEASGMAREVVLASTKFRREFMGELLLEESNAAVPRWEQMRGPDQSIHNLVQVLPRPDYFDAYVALDLGGHLDPHAVLFSWFDPSTGVLYFEDELELPSAKFVVGELVGQIKEKERALYGANRWDGTLSGAEFWQKEFGKLPEYLRNAISRSAPHQPLLRVGDNDNLVLNTLNVEHGLAVIPTKKNDKILHVDLLNSLVGQGKIKVHPRCVRFLTQLSSTTWNKARTTWERTGSDHGDLIDVAVYTVRNVLWKRDCRPTPYVDPYLMKPKSSNLREQFRKLQLIKT